METKDSIINKDRAKVMLAVSVILFIVALVWYRAAETENGLAPIVFGALGLAVLIGAAGFYFHAKKLEHEAIMSQSSGW